MTNNRGLTKDRLDTKSRNDLNIQTMRVSKNKLPNMNEPILNRYYMLSKSSLRNYKWEKVPN